MVKSGRRGIDPLGAGLNLSDCATIVSADRAERRPPPIVLIEIFSKKS
jgi:hypothetical protein